MTEEFDTLTFTKRLQAAGCDSHVAEEIANGINDVFKGTTATKVDINLLEKKIENKFVNLKNELNNKIENLGAVLRSENSKLELDLVKWGVLMFLSTAAVVSWVVVCFSALVG